MIRLPESGKGPVGLHLYRAGGLSPSGKNVYLDPSSGMVLKIDRVVDRPAGARFLASMAPIHYGQRSCRGYSSRRVTDLSTIDKRTLR